MLILKTAFASHADRPQNAFKAGFFLYKNTCPKSVHANHIPTEAAENILDKQEPTEHAIFMIKARYDARNGVDENNFVLYIKEPFVNGKGNEFYKVPNPIFENVQQMEEEGRKAVEDLIKLHPNSNKLKYYYNSYNRIAARNYARRWTSNAGYNGNCYMDETKWNNLQYPYYPSSYCNDCADYVSQSLHAGGIPIDPGQWDRLKDGNGTFPWAWTNVPHLEDYMKSHNYWQSADFYTANAGNVIVIPNYHAMIITLNDTIHRTFSAHTNDRNDYPYYGSNGWKFYSVRIPIH